MNDELTVDLIRQQLNSSSAKLGQPTLIRLSEVRMQALARYDSHKTSRRFACINALAGSVNSTESHRNNYYWSTALLCLAILFGGIIYWQNVIEQDITDLEIAILTDDLPIDAYVD
jgi:hypothetical protein